MVTDKRRSTRYPYARWLNHSPHPSDRPIAARLVRLQVIKQWSRITPCLVFVFNQSNRSCLFCLCPNWMATGRPQKCWLFHFMMDFFEIRMHTRIYTYTFANAHAQSVIYTLSIYPSIWQSLSHSLIICACVYVLVCVSVFASHCVYVCNKL